MKNVRLIFGFAVLFSFLIHFRNASFLNNFDHEKLESTELNTEKGLEPIDYFFAQRAFPQGFVDRSSFQNAAKQASFFQKNNIFERGGANWQFAGPSNLGGRISTLAAHPSEPNTVYVGAANGGIFKTTDAGGTWTPIFEQFPSISMGDIQIAPTNKNKIYVGTGEANGGGGSMSFDGLGVWKSADAGQNWQQIGLKQIASVGKIVIDPTNENRVFVAGMGDLYGNDAERGIFRTLDGGSNWQKVLFANDSTGGIDLAMNAQQPDTVFAALFQRIRRPDRRQYGGPSSGIFRTLDGGANWIKLGNGLPTGALGRIGLATAPSLGSTVYAVLSNENGTFKGIYRSKNSGNSWALMFSGAMPGSFYSNYGWWFGKIWVDPTNADRVIVAGLEVFESLDGGANWENISVDDFGSSNMHVDHHALWINPADPSHIYCGNDGGFYQTLNGGTDWVKSDNLPISQFYANTIDFLNPEIIYGGAQDNGTWRATSGASNDWVQIFGGDGFVPLVDPTDNNFVYVEYQYGALQRSDDGGYNFYDISQNGIDPDARTNWHTPVILHPNDPTQLFYGAEKLWFSGDRGDSWQAISPDLGGGQPANLVFGTITTIAVSPVDGQTIWCGTDDGFVWKSADYGQNWQNITQNLPKRWITRLTASPFDAQTAYCSVSGYRWNEALPHVFKTTDGGQNWIDISANLPEAPVNDILVDPADPNTIWVASDFGVFVSYNDGGIWEMLASGLPNVPVTDLTFHEPTRKMVASTFGRSMYSINLETISAQESSKTDFSMQILGNPMLADGSHILFNFSKNTRGALEVFNAAGQFLKTISTTDFSAGTTSMFISKNEFPAAGLFFIRLKTSNGSFVKKVLVMD